MFRIFKAKPKANVDVWTGGQFVKNQSERLIEEWESLLPLPKDGRAPASPLLKPTLAGFLANLADALDAHGTSIGQLAPIARARGAEACAIIEDRSLDQLMTEYGALREVLIGALLRRGRKSAPAIKNANHFIDEAIRAALIQFSELSQSRETSIKADLKMSQGQLGKAVEVSKIGFYDWNIQTDHLIFSPQMQKDWGIAANTRLADVVDFIDPRDRDRVRALIEATIKNRVPYHTQYRVHRPDGRTAWIEARGEVSVDANNEPCHFLGTSLDITERKKNEALLAEQTVKLQRIVEVAPVAIGLLRGHDLVFEIVNPELQAIFPNRQLTGKNILAALPELADQPFLESIKNVWSTGEPFTSHEMKAILNRPDGQEESRFFDISYIRINDQEGKAYGVYTFAHDVTDRVNARRAIEKSAGDLLDSRVQTEVARKNIESLFTNSNVAVAFLRGPEHRFVYTNPAHRKILGFNAEGLTIREAQPEIAAAGFINFLDEVYRDGKTIHFGASAHPIGDELRYFDLLYTPSRGPNGEIDGVMALAVDISELKRAHAEAARAREEAVRANEIKSLFLANMSHEIRTPLGAIIGFAEVLKDPTLEAKEREQYLNTVIRNGRSLTRIIDDILDLSKVEAGKVELERLPLDLHEFLADFASLMRMRARENGNTFEVDTERGLPDWILTDPTRLKQILVNAVGNAMKFTTKGSVVMRVSANEGRLEFRITDTGRGISPAQSEELFQPFAQADISTTRSFGGTGLGLVLGRRLCRLMGGDYRLEKSEIGVGSVFVASVRLEVPKARPRPVGTLFKEASDSLKKTRTLAGLRILVVEDSVDNQQLITLILAPRGAMIEVVSDGLVGVSRALGGEFDVVLMDIQMPVMDGHEAMRCLRASGYPVPVVALTAHAMKEERIKALESGFTDFLTKPIQSEALVAMVKSLARREKVAIDDGPSH